MRQCIAEGIANDEGEVRKIQAKLSTKINSDHSSTVPILKKKKCRIQKGLAVLFSVVSFFGFEPKPSIFSSPLGLRTESSRMQMGCVHGYRNVQWAATLTGNQRGFVKRVRKLADSAR